MNSSSLTAKVDKCLVRTFSEVLPILQHHKVNNNDRVVVLVLTRENLNVVCTTYIHFR